MNRKGNMFANVIIFGLAFMIFVFAVPGLFSIVSASAVGQGSATSFIMKAFLGIVLILLIAFGFKIIMSGDSFI